MNKAKLPMVSHYLKRIVTSKTLFEMIKKVV